MDPLTFWAAWGGQLALLGGLIWRLSWLAATMRSDISHNGELLVAMQSRLDNFSSRLNGAESQSKINKAAIEMLGRQVRRVEDHTGTPTPPGYGRRGESFGDD